MPTLSAFKNSVKTALKVPQNSQKPRSKRQVITFDEAFDNLRTSQNGFVTCAAFHAFGRCRKEIPLLDSNFLANLAQFDLGDIQAPIKLMPLMLCPTHWGKTVYHNALFLSWLSVYGSKQDHPHFENTVVDYQSAVVLDDEENASSQFANISISKPDNQQLPVSAPNISITDEAQTNLNDEHRNQSPSEPEPDHAAKNLPEISVLAGVESYASIELGVANLEIMYQENLKCIAMTTDGWRCPTVIHKEQVLEARELLDSYATFGSEVDIQLVPKLVLCSGHAMGDLPRIYSEKWALFSGQRLSKEEAMSKFNADSWLSVQFFSKGQWDDIPIRSTKLQRPRSTSNLSSRSGERSSFGSAGNAGGVSLDLPSQKFEFSLPDTSFDAKFGPVSGRENFLGRAFSTGHPANHTRTKSQPHSALVPISINVQPIDEKTTTTSTAKEVVNEAIQPDQTPASQGSRADHHYQDIELISEMRSPNIPGGFVHIFQPPGRKLCRIGKATTIETRNQQIRAGCELAQLEDSELVNMTAIRTRFPERVIKLVHLQLREFQAKLSCEGRHNPEYVKEGFKSGEQSSYVPVQVVLHGEWFDVPEEVAFKSVWLWSDFAARAYTPEGTIKKEWAMRLALLPRPGATETGLLQKVHEDGLESDILSYHLERINRYAKWIREGSV